MDIDSSQDVLISNCYLDTGDDAICLKSGKDADGLRVNRPTANVAITNCTVHHGHGAVVLGSETSGGFHNIVASNIVCQGTEKGVRIKSTRGRGRRDRERQVRSLDHGFRGRSDQRHQLLHQGAPKNRFRSGRRYFATSPSAI